MQNPMASSGMIPRGVGCPPPPGMDTRKGKGKLMCIKVRMLDDSVGVFHLGHKATGQALFDEVCRHLNLLESDYFGLAFIDSYGNTCWLDKEKSILRQILASHSDARFFFIVKFYTPTPAELEEEYTRYLFALQIRRDLARGELICSNESTAALLVALIVQSECGDFSPLDYSDANAYLNGAHFIPHQTPAFAQAVREQHKRMIGMGPSEADFALLETARRCDFYGLKLHPAHDIEGTEVCLAVAHMGIKVFHQLNCVTTFSWAKVRKLSFKRKRLMIKIHPDSSQFYKETIEFMFDNRDNCKNFWKKCVEHHSFFRCEVGGGDGRHRSDTTSSRRHLFVRGSNFVYQGRTQKQLIDYISPLRRGCAFGNNGGVQQNTNNSLQRTQFFVYDRMATEEQPKFASNGQRWRNAEADNFGSKISSSNFPSLRHHGRQNGGNNETKRRPKSAVSSNERNIERNISASGVEAACQAGLNHIADSFPQNDADSHAVLLHQHFDPMSMSLPNVLADSVEIGTSSSANCGTSHIPLSADARYYSTKKSVSGENFHHAIELRENLNEGSYRVAHGAKPTTSNGDIGDASSSAASSVSSDIGGTSNQQVDPRVYQIQFNTKRLGNVIVKKLNSVSTTKQRPPLTSLSAIDAGERGADGTESVDSSSAAFSDYSLAATAPPAFCSSSATSLLSESAPKMLKNAGVGSRIRCAPSSAENQQLGHSLHKDLPVIIDGPPPTKIVNRNSGTHQPSKKNIIRPVVIPSPKSAPSSSPSDKGRISNISIDEKTSTSSTTATQSTAVRRPLVINTNQDIACSSITQKGDEIIRPIPGRVVRREDMVITTVGIGLKNGATTKHETETIGEKPKIPPKPDLSVLTRIQPEETRNQKNSATVEETFDPLESILKDVQAMNEALEDLKSPSSGTSKGAFPVNEGQHPHQHQINRIPPAAIAIESEEQPELRTVHLFNGEDSVPYTLTVRDLSIQRRDITATEGENRAAESGTSVADPKQAMTKSTTSSAVAAGSTTTGSRHKSIELVPRKRLPSQDSYSSQDHSISPTTPDSGNVLEYMMRRKKHQRSASSDRASNTSKATSQGINLRAERRQTQPVELGSVKISQNTVDAGDKKEEGRTKPDNDTAAGGGNVEISKGYEGEMGSSMKEHPQQLLETDF